MAKEVCLVNEKGRRVEITDVTLREYGQNVPAEYLHVFSPQTRIQIARELLACGFKGVEIFSCVSPRLAPAMSVEAIRQIAKAIGKVETSNIITLVPNKPGYRHFLDLELGPDGYNHTLGTFFSAVEAHNLLNLGRPIKETIDEYRTIARDAASRGIRLAAYVSAAFGFREPQKGLLIRPKPEELADFIDFFFDLGASTVSLSDLQGVASPEETRRVFEDILNRRKGRDLDRLGYHPHHVSGEMAIANSKAAYDAGIRRFDASLGGSGGCVTGAPGNQPTQGLVRAFEAMDIETGLDANKIGALADFVQREIYSKIFLSNSCGTTAFGGHPSGMN